MRSRNTWFWFGLAIGLFLFIHFFERRWETRRVEAGSPAPLLAGFKPEAVTGLQVRRGGQFVHLDRVKDAWKLTVPLDYPAQPVVVENLLRALAQVDRMGRIDSTELADFGLAEPQAIVLVHQGDARVELQVGSVTPTGDRVYVRTVGVEGIYTTDERLLSRAIPQSTDDWRSQALLTYSGGLTFDRFEVRAVAKGLGFAVQFDPTNRLWRLIKPMQVRADGNKVERLLLRSLQARVTGFVTDEHGVNLEPYGLQAPELELVLGSGTNDVLVVQFGQSPTNHPAVVYARRLSHTNVVTVPRDFVDALRASFVEFRDRHLFTFTPSAVQQIEVAGENPMVIRRQTNGAWRVVAPVELSADAGLMQDFLGDLHAWETAGFEKDVVTDFSGYGLSQPIRSLVLKSFATNAAGSTNILLAQVDLGTNNAGKFFARRLDENSVYAIDEADCYKIPQYGWQLRDRRVWDFSVTNVLRVTVRQGNRANQFIRTGPNDWSFGADSEGIINEFALEETVLRLGQLTAIYWVDRGEGVRTRHGISETGLRVDIDLKDGEGVQTLRLEFGPPRQFKAPLACATLDAQPWVFEMSWQLFQLMTRDLPIPQPPPGTAANPPE